MPSIPPGGKPLLVFDGDCGFCRHWIERWRRATGDKVEYAPYQQVAAWFPEIPEERFRASVQLIDPDGRVTQGAEAVFRSLAHARGGGIFLAAYRFVPGVKPVTELAYRIVARNRRLFSMLTRWVWGPSPDPPSYFLARWLFLKGLALVYLLAFLSLWPQIGGLVGPGGILPAERYLEAARTQLGTDAYRVLPTLAWLHPGGETPEILCLAGAVLALLLLAGVAAPVMLAGLWALYLSITVIGQDFLSFQWDALLLEAGFLALFVAPMQLRRGLGLASPPPATGLLMLRLLLFKLMFMSGMVKLLSGDPSWRDLTALSHHYQTQPLPNPLSWYVHHLPLGAHQASTAGMFLVELALPFLIFLPRRLRVLPATGFLLLQVGIAATGNYGFFNLLSTILVIPLLDDAMLARLLPARLGWKLPSARSWVGLPRRLVTGAVCAGVLVTGLAVMGARLGWPDPLPSPARSLLSWTGPWRTLNGYGLFAVMTVRRPEIQIEGSRDGITWKPYRFRWKAGSLDEAPPVVAPHMPRLDWQMWFAALGSPRTSTWFARLLEQLLRGSPEVTGLLADNPFPTDPPRQIRATLYEYRFTSPEEARASGGNWWKREEKGIYAGPASLRAP